MTIRRVLILVAVGVSLSANAQNPTRQECSTEPSANTRGQALSLNVPRCGFDSIRENNRAARENCMTEVKKTLCEKSMWKGLSLDERVQRIVKMAQQYSGDYGLDYRAAPCIITRESVWFDPLIVAFLSCKKVTTDQGLGQTVFTTFQDLVDHQGFRSKISPFNRPPYTTNARLLFDAMAMSVDLQIEVLMATLKVKLRAAGGDYEKAFEFYNGSDKKKEYGTAVNNCFECMRTKVPNSMSMAAAAQTNFHSCLAFPIPADPKTTCPGTDVVQVRFDKFQHFCEFGPPPPPAPTPFGATPTPVPPLNCSASNTNSGQLNLSVPARSGSAR